VCVHCGQGSLTRGGTGVALVAFSSNIETVPVTDLITVSDTENEVRACVQFGVFPLCNHTMLRPLQGRGLSVSFVLRLDPTEQCDDFVVGFFVKTLSLEAPNVMEAIGASGGDYGLGSKKSSTAGTRSSSPITKRGAVAAAGGMSKIESTEHRPLFLELERPPSQGVIVFFCVCVMQLPASWHRQTRK
jgi:hypothetical protein